MCGFSTGVRETFATKSKLINSLLTYISGKPSSNEFKFYLSNPYGIFCANLLAILVLIVMLYGVTTWSNILAHPLAFYFSILLAGRYRAFQVCHMHHCIHRNFFRKPVFDNIYADIICGLIFVQNRSDYSESHLGHHDRKIFTTELDADAVLLLELGFVPGKSKEFYYRHLICCFFDPLFHYSFIKARISTVWNSGSVVSLVTAFISAFGMALAVLYDLELALYTVIIPLFFLYNLSALLQFITEHLWLVTDDPPLAIHEYSKRCWGRFSGMSRRPGLFGTAYWLCHLVIIAIPTRFGVWVGDLPVHDWHHLAGFNGTNAKDWPGGLYLREEVVQHQDNLNMGKREIWGIVSALEVVFDGLSKSEVSYVDNKFETYRKTLAQL